MNATEKQEFLNILCKLHKVAEISNCSEELLNSIALTFQAAQIEFQKPYPLSVRLFTTDDTYQKFFKQSPSPIPINQFFQPKKET